MRNAVVALVATAVLAGVASPALAQASAADANDVRCLLVLQAVSRDPAQREKAGMGVYYYLGRLAGRGPLARIEGTMLAEGNKMNTPQVIQGELTRCGNELTSQSGALQSMNQKLQAMSKPAGAPAAPAKK